MKKTDNENSHGSSGDESDSEHYKEIIASKD